MGSGRDIVRAPLIAQKVPTSLPSPLTGYMSPYLHKKINRTNHQFLLTSHPTVVIVMMTQ